MKKKKRSTEQDEMRTERGTRAKLLRKMNAGIVARGERGSGQKRKGGERNERRKIE